VAGELVQLKTTILLTEMRVCESAEVVGNPGEAATSLRGTHVGNRSQISHATGPSGERRDTQSGFGFR
jgi:hypothetical protein